MATQKTPTPRRALRSLTFQEAVEVWLRYWSGEFQDRIAASFDVNPGRVNEVVKGHKHQGSREAALSLR